MKTIKIFIASSKELREERVMIAQLANSLNTIFDKNGIHIIAHCCPVKVPDDYYKV